MRIFYTDDFVNNSVLAEKGIKFVIRGYCFVNDKKGWLKRQAKQDWKLKETKLEDLIENCSLVTSQEKTAENILDDLFDVSFTPTLELTTPDLRRSYDPPKYVRDGDGNIIYDKDGKATEIFKTCYGGEAFGEYRIRVNSGLNNYSMRGIEGTYRAIALIGELYTENDTYMVSQHKPYLAMLIYFGGDDVSEDRPGNFETKAGLKINDNAAFTIHFQFTLSEQDYTMKSDIDPKQEIQMVLDKDYLSVVSSFNQQDQTTVKWETPGIFLTPVGKEYSHRVTLEDGLKPEHEDIVYFDKNILLIPESERNNNVFNVTPKFVMFDEHRDKFVKPQMLLSYGGLPSAVDHYEGSASLSNEQFIAQSVAFEYDPKWFALNEKAPTGATRFDIFGGRTKNEVAGYTDLNFDKMSGYMRLLTDGGRHEEGSDNFFVGSKDNIVGGSFSDMWFSDKNSATHLDNVSIYDSRRNKMDNISNGLIIDTEDNSWSSFNGLTAIGTYRASAYGTEFTASTATTANKRYICSVCSGTGEITTIIQGKEITRPCKSCDGDGYVGAYQQPGRLAQIGLNTSSVDYNGYNNIFIGHKGLLSNYGHDAIIFGKHNACGNKEYDRCDECKGEGKVRCTACCFASDVEPSLSLSSRPELYVPQGHVPVIKMVMCPNCQGYGLAPTANILCDMCLGKGLLDDGTVCVKCGQEGTIFVSSNSAIYPCDECREDMYATKGTGEVSSTDVIWGQCPECSGYGKSTCINCSGDGFLENYEHALRSSACETCRKPYETDYGKDKLGVTGLLRICPSCESRSAMLCTVCSGTGEINDRNCFNCEGTGIEPRGYDVCNVCKGDGLLEDGKTCTTCGGTGKSWVCDLCKGDKQVCDTCVGSGYLACESCDTLTGVNMLNGVVTYINSKSYIFDITTANIARGGGMRGTSKPITTLAYIDENGAHNITNKVLCVTRLSNELIIEQNEKYHVDTALVGRSLALVLPEIKVADGGDYGMPSKPGYKPETTMKIIDAITDDSVVVADASGLSRSTIRNIETLCTRSLTENPDSSYVKSLSRGWTPCLTCNSRYPLNVEDCPYCSGRGRFYGTHCDTRNDDVPNMEYSWADYGMSIGNTTLRYNGIAGGKWSPELSGIAGDYIRAVAFQSTYGQTTPLYEMMPGIGGRLADIFLSNAGIKRGEFNGEVCSTCDGRGYIDKSYVLCPTCSGDGFITKAGGTKHWWMNCVHCSDARYMKELFNKSSLYGQYGFSNTYALPTYTLYGKNDFEQNMPIMRGKRIKNALVEVGRKGCKVCDGTGNLRALSLRYNFAYHDNAAQPYHLQAFDGFYHKIWNKTTKKYEYVSVDNGASAIKIRYNTKGQGEPDFITTAGQSVLWKKADNTYITFGDLLKSSAYVYNDYSQLNGMAAGEEIPYVEKVRYEYPNGYSFVDDIETTATEHPGVTATIKFKDYDKDLMLKAARSFKGKFVSRGVLRDREPYDGAAPLVKFLSANIGLDYDTAIISATQWSLSHNAGSYMTYCPQCCNSAHSMFSADVQAFADAAKTNNKHFRNYFAAAHNYTRAQMEANAFVGEFGYKGFCDTCNPNNVPVVWFKDGQAVLPDKDGKVPTGAKKVTGIMDCYECGNDGLQPGQVTCTGCLGRAHWYCSTCKGDGEVEYRPTIGYEDGKVLAVGDGYFYKNLFPREARTFNFYDDYVNIKPDDNCNIGRGDYIKKMNLFSVENNGLLMIHNNNYDEIPTSDVKHTQNKDFFAVRSWASYDSLDERFANLQNCCYTPDGIYFPKRTTHNEEWKLRIRELHYLITDSYIKTNASMLKTTALNQAIADFYANNHTYLLKLGPIISYAFKGVWKKGAKGSKGVKGQTKGTKGRNGMKGLKGLKGTKGAKGYYTNIVITNKRYKYTLADILHAVKTEYGQTILDSGNLGKDETTYTFYCLNEDSENYLWFKGVRMRQLSDGRYQTLNCIKGCSPFHVQRIVYKNNGYNGEYGVMNFDYSFNKQLLT